MLTITRLVQEQECSLCQKPKDGCCARFADEQGGESVLCWACLKKMANRKMRLAEGKGAGPAPIAKPQPANGPAMAMPVK